MKKQIIAIAIAASAVVVNAATIMWGIESAYAPTGEEFGDVTGYYAYMLVDSATAGTATVYTHENAVAQVSAGKVDFLSNASGSPEEIDWGASGTSADVFANNSTVGAYLVIINAAAAADATLAYVSDVKTTEINGMGASSTLNWGDMAATATAGNWSTVGNVPEPTSGLLLILGMAGLALKRKRA